MNRWRLFLAALFLGFVCACAAQQEKTSPATTLPSTKGAITEEARLPCAETESGESLAVSYGAESLYRGGAALPKAEGLACLETLADWLKIAPQNSWLVTVSGEADHGFDPLALAGKRRELLQRFFTRKGIDVQSWKWQTVAGAEKQLQLQLLQLKSAP